MHTQRSLSDLRASTLVSWDLPVRIVGERTRSGVRVVVPMNRIAVGRSAGAYTGAEGARRDWCRHTGDFFSELQEQATKLRGGAIIKVESVSMISTGKEGCAHELQLRTGLFRSSLNNCAAHSAAAQCGR